MSSGLRIRDASGAVQVDVTTRFTRLLGYVNPSSSGSKTDAMLSEGTGFVVPILDQNGTMYPANVTLPTISGTTLSWTVAAPFFYGIR